MRATYTHRLARLLQLLKLSWRNMDVTNLNVFALCKFLRHAGKIMVLIVVALVVVIWYSVLVNAFIPGLRSNEAGRQALCALGVVAYTLLIGMILWSYLATFWTCPGLVPAGWTPFPDEEAALHELQQVEQQLQHQQQQQRSAGQGALDVGRAYLERPRFCKKCQAWKPPRAHHCSMTGRCVLKMDHYCVWVLNCVGLLNYKYFILFLGYTFLGCLASTALLIRPCIQFFSFENPPLGRTILAFICFVFSAAFSLALMGFLIMHLRLVAMNLTTIEAYEKRPVKPWPYDRGRKQNFQEVFGQEGWSRFAPLRSQDERRALLVQYIDGISGSAANGLALGAWSAGSGAGSETQLCLTSNDSEHTL